MSRTNESLFLFFSCVEWNPIQKSSLNRQRRWLFKVLGYFFQRCLWFTKIILSWNIFHFFLLLHFPSLIQSLKTRKISSFMHIWSLVVTILQLDYIDIYYITILIQLVCLYFHFQWFNRFVTQYFIINTQHLNDGFL